MAEIFGAIASGIGIAGVAAQAIDGIRKLQTFCNDVRDAPEEIEYMINELEILLNTLVAIEAQIQRNASVCSNLDASFTVCPSERGILERCYRETQYRNYAQAENGLDKDGMEEEGSRNVYGEDREIKNFARACSLRLFSVSFIS
jgi:predicted hydrocarbon binding protein